ncbi:hypothetical protein ACJJTC_005041, partial [Scirpophaga incertulas]
MRARGRGVATLCACAGPRSASLRRRYPSTWWGQGGAARRAPGRCPRRRGRAGRTCTTRTPCTTRCFRPVSSAARSSMVAGGPWRPSPLPGTAPLRAVPACRHNVRRKSGCSPSKRRASHHHARRARTAISTRTRS